MVKLVKYVEPQIKDEKIEPIVKKALNNFEKEMKKPYSDFEDSPENIKVQIFQVLLKHYILGLMNDKELKNENLKEITKRIEDLKDPII
ncbi:MAG: hypothetical protein ACTSU2_06955 [Promethearchaeota archaeon]